MTPSGQKFAYSPKSPAFFGKVKQKHKPLKIGCRVLNIAGTQEWGIFVKREAKNRVSGWVLQSENKKVANGRGSLLCHQSTGRFSLCFFVNSSAFFMNFARSLVNSSARSALSGCSG